MAIISPKTAFLCSLNWSLSSCVFMCCLNEVPLLNFRLQRGQTCSLFLLLAMMAVMTDGSNLRRKFVETPLFVETLGIGGDRLLLLAFLTGMFPFVECGDVAVVGLAIANSVLALSVLNNDDTLGGGMKGVCSGRVRSKPCIKSSDKGMEMYNRWAKLIISRRSWIVASTSPL